MTASRGDTRPCTAADCSGTMQFGRRGDRVTRAAALQRLPDPEAAAMEVKGWVCSAEPAHFSRAEE